MKTNFITDENGKKTAVVLSIKDFDKVLQELEELEDIRLYDKVKAKKEPSIPLKEFIAAKKKA